MADASVRRRRHGEDAIYFAADKNRYIGAVSVGFGPDGKRLRRKVSGKTKQEVRDKLRALHAELNVGLQSSAGYTVRAAVDDWLEHGLSGRSARTVQLYRDGVRPLTDRIGARTLSKLSAADVRSALAALSDQLSTRSLQIAHNCLVRAIRHAEADDLVGRNVAALVRPPAGSEGRPSKALSVEQAQQLLRAAAGERPGDDPYRLHAYVVLLLTTGLRPEEARALRWDHVDLGARTVAVWRSDRTGGDTKTPRSRRTLRLAQIAVAALHQRKAAQAADRLKAGKMWQDTGLVFTTTVGTMFDQHNIRRATPSSVLCRQAASPSRRSPGSPVTGRPARPSWSTAGNCARSPPPVPRSWTGSSRHRRRESTFVICQACREYSPTNTLKV
jgi:integrase